jgi:AcrR family transcriptional regulator
MARRTDGTVEQQKDAVAATNGPADAGSAREAILEVAIEQLASGGEAAVRLATIAERAGVAIGLISYHFGGRDGLIVAAQKARFEGRLRADVEVIQDIMDNASGSGQMLEGLRSLTGGTVASRDAAPARLQRIALLGSMLGRPELEADLGELQGGITDQLTEVLRRSQEAGLVRDDLDARAIAVFAQAYAIGMVLADIDPRRPSDADLTEVVLAALGSLST